jgi:hypothetical protein
MKLPSGKSRRMPRWSITTAANAVVDAARNVDAVNNHPGLVEAKLADHYRDAGVPPVSPEVFASITEGLCEADWRRFEVVVNIFETEELCATFAEVSSNMSVQEQIAKGMLPTVKALHAVSENILATSMVRAEELARRVAKGLGIGFNGESVAASAERQAKIDYTRLLSKVDAAKASAEEQLAKLFEHQEDADNRIQRRGKW